MVKRIESFFDFLALGGEDRARGMQAAALAGKQANGMTDTKDYEALAAIALHFKPLRIFEIGTYLGVTSDFFLALLPECRVVSIAYQNPRWKLTGNVSNNSELTRKQIGSAVQGSRRSRFTQLFGDSHKLSFPRLVEEYGHFDLVFIDGDHSRKGVAEDTQLATQIITGSGVICWHDANPKPKYADVRRFLEEDLSHPAIATKDEYEGGIACWSKEIEARLDSKHSLPASP
jgi:predicted O-methyltransferase YrrM